VLADPCRPAHRARQPRCRHGGITEVATGYDGYTCILPRSTGTVAEILRQNRYATGWVGKNHNTPQWETSEVGPFDRWPGGLGFDYFYGFNSGDTSQFEPVLFENRNRVPRSADPDYHLSTDLADKAIAWLARPHPAFATPTTTKLRDARHPEFATCATQNP
jgi:arylsulfatase A-like enzyme